MGIKVYRNSKESADRLISRFNKKMQASRILLQVKENRYYKKKPNKRYLRQAAIMRDFHRSQREKMKYY
jgi:ribosomal protein S21